MSNQTVTIHRLNVELLRRQLASLLDVMEYEQIDFTNEDADNLGGLVNLIEGILDSAELLPEPLPTLLRQGVKETGSRDPWEVIATIEEQLTGEQYKIAFAFLTWLRDNDFTFGWNIQEVYQAYKSGDTSGLKTLTEISADLGISHDR